MTILFNFITINYARLLLTIGLFLIGSINTLAEDYSMTRDPIDECLIDLELKVANIKSSYNDIINPFYRRIHSIEKSLASEKGLESKLNLFLEKDRILDSVKAYKQKRKSEINKLRYLKGVEIIKILYEKSLSLDHHYTAITTLHNLEQISNPNNYKEFSVAKERLLQKSSRKNGFDLGKVLGNNIYTSVIHSMLSLFSNENLSKPKKDGIVDTIECILDFTLQMNNDLKIVYFETMYLRTNGQKTIRDIEGLFSFYTKPIDYNSSLQECRSNDDWLTISEQISVYTKRLDFLSESKISWDEAEQMQIELEFSIERLLQLIYSYNQFINQSAKFYEKFAFMLDSYQNEDLCVESIPVEFVELKESINITIQKFHNTYKPVELNGSKMKQLLYGVGY